MKMAARVLPAVFSPVWDNGHKTAWAGDEALANPWLRGSTPVSWFNANRTG
ncbi:hypothetical protein [Rhodohalobacter sp. 8-1]|uniref:hypothetical protein n=1 Tax=Rhodohalobacter sp. 8-1 TaxID=3131972 RepID=UPI0030EF9D5B